MKILGLDSSGLVASVAIAEDDNLLGEYTVNYKKTHSQTLLPMLDEIVKMTETARMIELDLSSIDAIAVAGGPGSFTGLRIGSATAKGLGLALEKPILNVPTVDALAYNLVGHRDMVCPLMDARRNQTYTGLYRFDGNDMQVLRGECAVGIDEIAAESRPQVPGGAAHRRIHRQINQRTDPIASFRGNLHISSSLYPLSPDLFHSNLI